jgi:hypothetical protein
VINNGRIEATKDDGALAIYIYYDATVDPAGPQPLIDGPRGWCLDVTNLTGSNQQVEVTLPSGAVTTMTFGQGDPVTTGPSRSRTAAQMAALGFTTRQDVAGFSL